MHWIVDKKEISIHIKYAVHYFCSTLSPYIQSF